MLNITFKTLKQAVYNMDVDPSITINELKEQLKQYGFEPETIRLIFKGKILEGDNTVESYKYNPEAKDFIVIMTIIKPKQEIKKEPENVVVSSHPINNPVNDNLPNDNLVDNPVNDVLPNDNPVNDNVPNGNLVMNNMAQMMQQNPAFLLGWLLVDKKPTKSL